MFVSYYSKKNQRKKCLAEPLSSNASSGSPTATKAAVRFDLEKVETGEKPSTRRSSTASASSKLGTLDGVFLPCISQILGVIFFLRLPTITGQAGTIGASMIILVCVLSTFVTSLSLSAIASNGQIQAGGPYYVISRTLGVEVGGSLGLLFYLGTALGGAMYVMGAVEVLQTNMAVAQNNGNGVVEEEGWFGWTQFYSLVLMTLLTSVVTVGVKYVNNAATFFLMTVALSIASIMIGTVLFSTGVYDGNLSDDERVFMDNVLPNYEPDPQTGVTPDFFSLMALFYPSVTGIMAGTNRSAKLATPNESIPIGTIGAILVTSLLYLFQVWLLGSVVSHETLLANKLVLACIAYPSRFIVKLGIITSCIGAALQCLAGAPQLLEAIAVDGAIPFLRFVQPSAHTSRQDMCDILQRDEEEEEDQDGELPVREPTRAIWVTWFIASLATLAGNLDHITPILTMFFLLMYGGINLCCYLLAWVRAPGFRPTFRYFHRTVSLFGFVWCLGLALMISWMGALLSIGLFGLNYKYISTRKSTSPTCNATSTTFEAVGSNWGDVGDSLRYKLTTAVLMKVTGTENFHAKNWRPQLITFVDTDDHGDPTSMEVLALANQLKKGRGLNVVVSIKKGTFADMGVYESSQIFLERLKKHMDDEGVMGFAEVTVTNATYSEAVWSAVIHSGLGPVSPNIALFAWKKNWRDCPPEQTGALAEAIKGLTNMKRAVVLFKGSQFFPRHGDIIPDGLIDIYWVVDDGGMCLLLPYLISKNRIWRHGVTLRVFAVTTEKKEDAALLEAAVVEHMSCVRIPAVVQVIDMKGTTLANDMREMSNGVEQRKSLGEVFSHVSDEPEYLNTYDAQRSSSSEYEPTPIKTTTANKNQSGRTIHSQIETAKLFNSTMRHHSRKANLVVTNLPSLQKMNSSQEFMEYTDTMCIGIENILLVRGSGATVVTAIA